MGVLAGNETPLVTVVQTAAPGFPINTLFPFIAMVAVANGALLNMLMASRLLYGMSKQQVLPGFLKKVHPTRRTPWAGIVFTTVLAYCLITYVSLDPEGEVVALLGGTTSLLLLCVFATVNTSVLVLRRDKVEHTHFRAGNVLPVLGVVASVYLVLPWSSGRPDEQYEIGGVLLALGIVLWAVTWFSNRALRSRPTVFREPSDLS